MTSPDQRPPSDPWHGQGMDPWLPARLDAAIHVREAEEEIRVAFWAALSAWLVGTARRVLRAGLLPDLDAVWARVPAWHEAVGHLVQGEIKAAVGIGFQRLMGSGYAWDQRPFVARYLTEVTNRLVRVPDEVFDLIAHEVQFGVGLGEGVAPLAKRVDRVLSTTASERWPNRATVVARTEAIGALNAGRSDAFQAFTEETDQPMQKLWLATEDSRTRPTHRAADGQRVPVAGTFEVGGFHLAFPGDPTGPAQEVIQCRCTMLLVEPGENVDMSNRQMRGRR
jgi:hypothetical protein